jgi:hypothetical protein
LEWKVDPVADLVTTAGDTLYATAADTLARLAIGTAGQVLQVNSGATAPEWATPAGGSSTFVGCKLKKTAATYTIANVTLTALTFDSEEFDTDAFHDNSTNNSRITIPSGKNGKYLFLGTFRINGGTSGEVNGMFSKNGTQITVSIVDVPNNGTVLSSEILNLVAGDYIEFKTFQNSGGTRTYEGTDGAVILTSFSCQYLGA